MRLCTKEIKAQISISLRMRSFIGAIYPFTSRMAIFCQRHLSFRVNPLIGAPLAGRKTYCTPTAATEKYLKAMAYSNAQRNSQRRLSQAMAGRLTFCPSTFPRRHVTRIRNFGAASEGQVDKSTKILHLR